MPSEYENQVMSPGSELLVTTLDLKHSPSNTMVADIIAASALATIPADASPKKAPRNFRDEVKLPPRDKTVLLMGYWGKVRGDLL